MNEEIYEGAEEQDLADPVNDDEVTLNDDDSTPGQQSSEDNSKFAAARRKAEAERDADRQRWATEKANLEAEIIGSLGLTDSKGTIIKSRAELNKYRDEQSANEMKALAMRLGVSEDDLSSAIEHHPSVVRAKGMEHEAQVRAAKERVDAQIKEITKIDPSIKNFEDLSKSESYPKVKELYGKGYSLEHAYLIANREALARKSADVAKQSALNGINSKNHLQNSQSGISGDGKITVPEETRKMYKLFHPEWTEKQITDHYAKYANK